VRTYGRRERETAGLLPTCSSDGFYNRTTAQWLYAYLKKFLKIQSIFKNKILSDVFNNRKTAQWLLAYLAPIFKQYTYSAGAQCAPLHRYSLKSN
jgi:hypothetical protein